MLSWSDIPKNPKPKVLRQFSAAWLLFFVILGARQYLKAGHHELGLAFGAAGILIGGLGLIRPAAVRWVFVGWMALAFPIGWVVSHVMLLVMFYAIITPVALLLRVRGRDSLGLRRRPDAASYWLPKETPRDVRSYLRQY